MPNDTHQQFYYLVDKIKRTIRQKEGIDTFIEFEHGMGCTQENPDKQIALGKSIYHAHWHIAPVSTSHIAEIGRDLHQTMEDFEIKPILFSNHRYLEEAAENINNRPYLLIKEGSSGFVVVEDDKKSVPSQFFRRMITELEDNKSSWDWKEKLDPATTTQNLVKTFELFGQ